MRASFKLFTLLGIPVDINATWLIAFGLISWTFATGAYPLFFQAWSTQQYWFAGVVTAFLLFASVLAHELGHSVVAMSQGLKVKGITLLLFGGVSKIEGNASRPRNEFLIAFAGPATSFVIGITMVGWWIALGREVTTFHGVMFFTGWMNILVAGFNLLPGYPLDGGRVLRSFVWAITGNFEVAARIVFVVGRALFYLMIGWGVWTAFEGDLFGGIWIVLVGWFLLSSAKREEAGQNVITSHTRDDHDGLGFNVGLASRPMSSMIDVHMTAFEVQSGGFLIGTPVSIPVARDGELVGFITPKELSELHDSERTEVVIAQIMNPDSLRVISASEPAHDALRAMDRYQVSQLVVMEKTHLLGMVTRQDVLAKMIEFTLSEETDDAPDGP